MYDKFPINLASFKQEKHDLESNLNRFLPWLIDATMWLLFENIEDLFILDEDSREYLYKHVPELLEQYGGSEIQKYIHETKKTVEQNLWE